MTCWQLPGRIGVGDSSVGSGLPCDSLLVSLHEEQLGTCVCNTLGIEGSEKLHQSTNTTASPAPLLRPPSRQSSFFLGWICCWGLVIVWVYVYEKTLCWIIHIPYGGWHSRSSQNQSWCLDGIIERRENGKHCRGSMAWCSHKYIFMALCELGAQRRLVCTHKGVCVRP